MVPVTERSPRSIHRMRSEKARRGTGGRGFDSRHLHGVLGRKVPGQGFAACRRWGRRTRIGHKKSRTRCRPPLSDGSRRSPTVSESGPSTDPAASEPGDPPAGDRRHPADRPRPFARPAPAPAMTTQPPPGMAIVVALVPAMLHAREQLDRTDGVRDGDEAVAGVLCDVNRLIMETVATIGSDPVSGVATIHLLRFVAARAIVPRPTCRAATHSRSSRRSRSCTAASDSPRRGMTLVEPVTSAV